MHHALCVCRTHFALFELGTQSLVSNLIWHYLLGGAINAYIKCLISLRLHCAAHYMLFFMRTCILLPIYERNQFRKLVKSAPNAFIINNNKCKLFHSSMPRSRSDTLVNVAPFFSKKISLAIDDSETRI